MENTKSALVSLSLAPANGLAPAMLCNSFDEANMALAKYDRNYWEHAGESVKCKGQWENGLCYEFSISLPEEKGAVNLGFIEGILQETLEDELSMPPDALNFIKAREWISLPGVLYTYTVRNKEHYSKCYRLLEGAEGFDHERFRAKENLLNDALGALCMEYPFIRSYMLDTQDLLAYASRLPYRTKAFKRLLYQQVQSMTIHAYAVTLQGHDFMSHELQGKLVKFREELEREKAIKDERFTYIGTQLYHMFPLDRLELCPSPHAITDAQAEEFRLRMEAVRLAPSLVEDFGEHDSKAFYYHYAHALDRVLVLPEATRSHRQVSVLTACALRSDGESDKFLELMLRQYDPYAIGYADYGHLILTLLNVPNLKIVDA